MKKLLISVIALASFSGPGIAADLYSPEPAMYDWSGAYVGGHVGYLWGDVNLDPPAPFGPIGPIVPVGPPGPGGPMLMSPISPNGEIDGVIGGIVGGWNFQNGPWVFGIEGDFGWTGADGSRLAAYDSGGPCINCDAGIPILVEPEAIYENFEMNWNAHIRARVGTTLGDEGRTLLFVAGGLAMADFDITNSRGIGAPFGTPGGTFTGWSIGGGVNHAFGNKFIAGLEVLYDNYGSEDYVPVPTGGIIACQIGQPCPPRGNVDLDTLTVRASLTYHFN